MTDGEKQPKPYWNEFNKNSEGSLSKDPNWSYTFLTALSKVRYKDGYGLLLTKDKKDPKGRWYFQVECERPDIFTGEIGIGRGGKAYLTPHMTESELSRLIFGLFLAYETHECREFFLWMDRAVYGPHIDVDALWSIADQLDFRSPM